MQRILALTLALNCLVALADRWPSAKPMGAASPDGTLVVRTTPGDDQAKLSAKAVLYQYSDKGFAPTISFPLVNEVSPVVVLISNGGTVFTFDNWYETGHGKVVVVYDRLGRVVASYTLAELYPTSLLKGLERYRSVSSLEWICRGVVPWINHGSVLVNDSIGGRFVFHENGKFNYSSDGVCKHGV